MNHETPKPGSPEAMKLGCTCPEDVNYGGQGFMLNGESKFWYAKDCPVHVVFDKLK